MESSLPAGFNKAQESWKEEKESLLNQAKTALGNLGKVRLTESERVEKLLAERNASSTPLHGVLVAYSKIRRDREEKREKTAERFLKIERPLEQERSGVENLRVSEVSDLREKISTLMKWREKIRIFRLCRAL